MNGPNANLRVAAQALRSLASGEASNLERLAADIVADYVHGVALALEGAKGCRIGSPDAMRAGFKETRAVMTGGRRRDAPDFGGELAKLAAVG